MCHFPPLKSLSCCDIGSRVLESWYYFEKYQCRRIAYYCYQKLRQTNFFKKNFDKFSQIGCFKARNSTRKALILQQSPSNDMLQNKSFTGVIMGNLAHQNPRRNMHKLLGCIRTSLKRFLACLTLHRKEIRLRHLHKRTNPGSALVPLTLMSWQSMEWYNSYKSAKRDLFPQSEGNCWANIMSNRWRNPCNVCA